VNYKAHDDLSWFRPLLRGNSPYIQWFDIEDEYVLQGVRAEEVCMVKAEMDLIPPARRVGDLL
jgi:hypothetical protein